MTTVPASRCKALDKNTCAWHGQGAGFSAYRGLITLLTEPVYDTPSSTPIKEQSLTELTGTLVHSVRRADMQELVVRDALLFSARVHRTDTRVTATTSAGGHRGPYIEHPLRNTVRLAKWGVKDQDIFVGSLLHDTVEDHPELIIGDFSRHQVPEDESERRKLAFQVIRKRYNPEVERIVAGMSNPLMPKYMPAEEKNALYRQHVEEAIQDPAVCLGKLSDFVDNAFSLHHSVGIMSATGLKKRTAKYLPVAEMLSKNLHSRSDLPIPAEALVSLRKIADSGLGRLQRLADATRDA